MKKNTTPPSTIKKSKQKTKVKQKPGAYYEIYKDYFTGRKKPVPKRFIDKLGEDLVEWALKNNNALILTQFFLRKGIGSCTLYDWIKRFPDFKRSCEHAKQLIGNRREIGAITRKYEAGMIRTTMRLYSKDWKDLEDLRSDQRQKRDQTVTQNAIQWVMEKFPTTKEVPEKDDELLDKKSS